MDIKTKQVAMIEGDHHILPSVGSMTIESENKLTVSKPTHNRRVKSISYYQMGKSEYL